MLFEAGQDGAPLALLTLGVVGDNPPLPQLQPKLPEGIHLRWAFRRDLGFPWYGFYLFRKLTTAGAAATCAASQFTGLTPGPQPSLQLPIGLGTFFSDKNLVFTDDFAPLGTIEIDLSGRSFVRFQMDQNQPSGRVDVKIGFIADFPPANGGGSGTGTGGSGSGAGRGLGAAGGASSNCGCGCDHAALVPIAERVVAVAPGQYRATFGYRNEGTTPISLPVGPDNRFFPDPADRGQPTLLRPGQNTGAFSVLFDGRPLTWRLAGHTVTVSAADATTGGDPGSGGGTSDDGIVVTALRFGIEVDRQVVAGRAGQIVPVSLIADTIDEVRVTSGPARLVDLCVTRTTADSNTGWEPVPGFPQPMSLPVRTNNYPAFRGAEDRTLSENTAVDRITYAFPFPNSTVLNKDEWRGAGFDDLYAAVLSMVQHGPNVDPFITDHVDDITAAADANDPNAQRPVISQVSTLDLVLAGALHPAIAQMLGLYFVDQTAVEGQRYDYVLVADYNNAGNNNVNTILSLVLAGNYTNIDAYKARGVVRAVTPPLAAPPRDATPDQEGLQAYLLPLFSLPPGGAGDLAGSVGLRWGLEKTPDGKIAPTGPVLYNVWRDTTGRRQPVEDDVDDPAAFTLITGVPVAAREPDPSVPPPPPIPGFPAASLYMADGPLLEGWYSYRVSGIDLFGRHSALSEPAPWLDVGDLHVRDELAVHVIDTVPPPPPVRAQAWLLDPKDELVIKDAAYAQWRGNNSGIGLRVRWSWGAGERRQAPDTREFRIYLHPNASSLVNANDVTNWAGRIAVVGVGERILPESLVPQKVGNQDLAGQSVTINGALVTLNDGPSLANLPIGELELKLVSGSNTQLFAVLGIDADSRTITIDQPPSLFGVTTASSWALLPLRTYEVFLPGTTLAVPSPFTSPAPLPAENPIVYSLVGVSASDDKDQPDPRRNLPAPQALVPRIGNEGMVGGPSTVVQIRRDPPPPPDAQFTQQNLTATRADFHSRSFFTLHATKKPAHAIHVFRALDETLFAVDAAVRFGGGAPSNPNSLNPASFGWGTTPGRLSDAANKINTLTATGYDQLTLDAVRVLASLPSNDAAFVQLTATPLASDAGDDRGLSDPPEYVADPTNHAAFTDVLDGRATNHYFYRTAYADGVHNIGPLGTSTPPVFLPVVVVPRAPVIQKIVGGNRKITLTWKTDSTADVVEYHVYRSVPPAHATDILSMERVHVEPEVPLATRPVSRTWPDTGALGLTTYTYRIVAVTSDGRQSPPSQPAVMRATDADPPAAVTPTAQWTTVNNVTLAQLAWTSPDETLLQQRAKGALLWLDLGSFRAPGSYSVRDPFSDPTVTFEYRITARKYTGLRTIGPTVTLTKLP